MTIEKFVAETINVLELPQPNVIEAIDEEAILAARMADFQARADQAGFDYDVGQLETDPIKIDQEAHAYREGLMRARVNSAIRAVLPAYAQGSDLDAIVARANVVRLEVSPATESLPAVMETDAQLLKRYLATYGRPAAGSRDGITARVMEGRPGFRDIYVANWQDHGQDGVVVVYVLVEGGEETPPGDIDLARTALRPDDAMPVTDEWEVASSHILEYEIQMTITVPRGPDPNLIQTAVIANLQKAADYRFAIGQNVWRNYLEGAGYIGNVKRVELASPADHVTTDYRTAPFCTSIAVSVIIED